MINAVDMDDNSEIQLKNICCTCLSRDRKLIQLCNINDGVNNLYFLLSYDSEAYKEFFFKDTVSLRMCWECHALLLRTVDFRQRACASQKLLSCIADGRNDSKHATPLSKLTTSYKTTYDAVITSPSETANIADIDNFIDCNAVEVKTEEDDLDDVPLSEFNLNFGNKEENCFNPDEIQPEHLEDNLSEHNDYTEDEISSKDLTISNKKRKNKEKHKKKTRKKISEKNNKYYKTVIMSEKDMVESKEHRKLNARYLDANSKCESCVKGFKSQIELNEHNLELHLEKPEHTQCQICLCYIPTISYCAHKDSHYLKHVCLLCEYTALTEDDILTHLRTGHFSRQNKGVRKTPPVLRPGSKPRRNMAMMDQRTPHGYKCNECNKYFDNKNQRWKHVQRQHREGFRCHTCGKRFAFKNSLTRHEQLHQAPLPREECPVCHKSIRVDLKPAHALIHAARERHSCAACDKTFVSRASYSHHLKYAARHAHTPVLKYKCGMCDKGYRSRGELRDHENYQHRGHTQHQCPVCGKALATKRCITRHVKRAHDGIKENARDKMCQQCGKAFRDKKGLREHEYIHTGERPLSCEVCGCTFRQSASLYTHKKRVHKIHTPRKEVQLMNAEK